MNIFDIHQGLLDHYGQYVRSFLHVADEKIEKFIQQKIFEERTLWPDALVQLNPAYEKAATVDELVHNGMLHEECSRIFRNSAGGSFHLYRHQRAAIDLAAQCAPYVVTSGTGSGKSMTYFIPIFDAILRAKQQQTKTMAIVVYPMNALVNSQEIALKELAARYRQLTGNNMPVRFARYTGQETQEQKRALRAQPPHILLTNYVMLEMLLVRPNESVFVEPGKADLQFLVIDELHTYRGRQGADVALLIRRLKERCGNPHLLCVGTSATMASGRTGLERRKVVADFANRFFGAPIEAENIIEETLQRVVPVMSEPSTSALGQAVEGSLPPATWTDFIENPLSGWIENTFGLQAEADGNLRRRQPITLQAGAAQLAAQTKLPINQCLIRLQEMFLHSSEVKTPDGSPPFAFKLHQFISQGGSVYATLEHPDRRWLTLDGQFYAPGQRERLLYPLQFCRVCGQEYYAVQHHTEHQRYYPHAAGSAEVLDEAALAASQAGYLMIDPEGRWRNEPAALPEHWFDRQRPTAVKSNYEKYRPTAVWMRPNGEIASEHTSDALYCWFQPEPFMLCLNCGEAYTRRDTQDFRKLARLSSEGRSTATTLLTVSAVAAMRETELEREAQKILSFTDNRQDASLQTGHFNDFVQVALLRSALYGALQRHGELSFHNVAPQVVAALGLRFADFVRRGDDGDTEPIDESSLQGEKAWQAFRDLIEYRLYEDLRRGWRVVQPNLEQCGLLQVAYSGLDEVAQDDAAWREIPFFAMLNGQERQVILTVLLDEMRRQLTIDIEFLRRSDRREDLRRRVLEYIDEQWAFEEDERLRYASLYILPGEERGEGDFSLSDRSVVGRWLKGELRQQLKRIPTQEEYNTLIEALIQVLCSKMLLIRQTEGEGNEHRIGVRIRASALLWRLGDGTAVASPLRRYQASGEAYTTGHERVNEFFRSFYQRAARTLQGIEGGAHTAQVKAELREEREQRFRDGDLAALFCSPTMELGVDISDLNMVHLRNVPPTPANYAQRSGRAGRAGQPALVLAYCAAGSGHDQYFFRKRPEMVAGSVTPPRLELGNEDLVRAHLHAIWLAKTGIDLDRGGSLLEIVDTQQESYPLHPEVDHQISLSSLHFQQCLAEAQQVVAACGVRVTNADWFHADWVEQQLRQAPRAFDAALDRWRELYHAADEQFERAYQMQRQRYRGRGRKDAQETETAESLMSEAKRQLDLLTCQNTKSEEADFYPYRYLASEGFLPGYNFPALPVRIFLRRHGKGEFLARPRFLALSEFGPDNVIYHEGAKYQVQRAWLPVQDPEQRFTRAKLCESCGYLHEGDALNDDLCHHCHAPLQDQGRHLENLLEMPTVGAVRRERITCDEEERLRRGYEITTHYRFARTQDGRPRRRQARTMGQPAASGEAPVLLELVHAPAATLWRINHRWKRRREDGYSLNMESGQWQSQEAPAKRSQSNGPAVEIKPGVRLFVRDTANVLLLRPPAGPWLENPAFLPSLQYALARGIQELFQVEESELATERIGKLEGQQLLFWEAAEGGLGVLRRLVEEPDALAAVATQALIILHFDQTGRDLRPAANEDDGCAQACHECLLSYYNQRDHVRLNRHAVRDFLLLLQQGVTRRGSGDYDYEGHYTWLYGQTDSRSRLERDFLEQVYQSKRRLPDFAQRTIQCNGLTTIPDFYYEPNVCVYCNGSVHDQPQQRAIDERIERELKNHGYRVVTIDYARPLPVQLQEHGTIFGEAR